MIIHLDADAFFASVEQAEHPELRGKAMAVGGRQRGIIASATYEARKWGVYTPMPSARAMQVCPHLIIVRGDFSKYRVYSERMFGFAEQFTPWIERASIDEGYFDVGGNRQILPRAAAEALQQRIATELGITVSLGIGINKLISQIASKLRKPNAIVEVPAGTERGFLAPLASHWLPGVGTILGARLRAVGLHFIAQVAEAPLEFLAQVAGNYAAQLQLYSRGIDPRPLDIDPCDAKSYGMQETFEGNVTDKAFVLGTLTTMADELMSKVRRDLKAIRTVTITLRYSDRSDVTHGITLPTPTDLETDVYPLLPRLIRETWSRRASLRLAGLRLTNIVDPNIQGELLLDPMDAKRFKQKQAAHLLDTMRARSLPIMRAHSLPRHRE
ncbi:MAG: polymerase [Chthoniobacteraceae bacterium]|nr:polymerase [Chthoniobacteraceae bacterium]